MKVIFGLSMPSYKVVSVCWKQDDAVHERTLLSDGTMRDRVLHNNSLHWAYSNWSSSHSPCHAAMVTDIRMAFKYLGKKSDLVELLPECVIEPGE